MRTAFAFLVVALVAGCATPEPVPPATTATTTTTPTATTAATTTPTPPPLTGGNVALDLVADGLAAPTLLVGVPGLGLVAGEQAGRLVRLADGAAVLDLGDRVGAGGERGFLGFAVHPDDPRVGFASYTDLDGDSVLSRVTRASPEASFDAASEEALLRVDQPYANHNGGHVVFGPDGFLYWGLGDGGSGGDPHGNAQDKDALLGSILRLDVGASGPAAPAAGNPYVGTDGADEVWAKGLRNPWRFSFDRLTGDLWIGDVGQNREEEIDLQPASSRGGENYGWNVWEGNHRYEPLASTSSPPVAPVHTYPTNDGCAVTGGFVYRGAAIPSLVGTYVFSDYCHGDLKGVRAEGGAWKVVDLLATDLRVTSFGEDEAGELYVVDHGGTVHRLIPSSG